MKPRIKSKGTHWECSGAGIIGIGKTPTESYEKWSLNKVISTCRNIESELRKGYFNGFINYIRMNLYNH